MKPANILQVPVRELRCLLVDLKAVPPPTDQVIQVTGTSELLIVKWVEDQQRTCSLEPADAESLDFCQRLDLNDPSALVWVAGWEQQDNAQTLVTLGVVFFQQILAPTGPFHFGLSEASLEAVARQNRRLRANDVEEAAAWLKEQLLMRDHEGKPFCLWTGGPRGAAPTAFRILGQRLSADVAVEEGKWFVTKLVRAMHPDQIRNPVNLLRGDVDFVDATRAAEVRKTSLIELQAMRADPESYLNTWRLYQQKERELLVREIKEVRWVKYDRCVQDLDDPTLWQFEVDSWSNKHHERLKEYGAGDLQASRQLPETVEFPERLLSENGNGKRSQAAEEPFVCRLAGATSKGPRLRAAEGTDVKPPESGYIHVSFTGDVTRLRRRDEALERIARGAVPMPRLGLILGARATEVRHARKHHINDREFRRLFDGQSPTARQKEAVLTALNTPDIAVIQGPPGTGKTKVIGAIVKYLGEHMVDGAGASARVLVTSYQHDAVNKAAGAAAVHGLPALKVGSTDGGQGAGDPVETWRRRCVQELSAQLEKMPERSTTLRQAAAEAAPLAYQSLVVGDFRNTVERFLTLAADEIGQSAVAQIRERARVLAAEATVMASGRERERGRRAAWSIYASPTTFQDGGPDQARYAHATLSDLGLLGEQDAALLLAAADWSGQDLPPFLPELGQLRDRILDALRSSPVESSHLVKPDPELNAAIDTALAAWRKREEARPTSRRAILEQLHDDLGDGEEARRLILRYSTVFAATCQQAAGRVMSQEYQSATDSSSVQFETVIIDEAARANPLDLQIPMALAERRIVLVGDHRQLPHLLEPDVERELSVDLSTQQREALRVSLFERLFGQLGAARADATTLRVVTLDTQYRMHPALGALVSRCFYEAHGEPALRAGREAGEFRHGLPGFMRDSRPVCAAWVNVPLTNRSQERRDGSSWTRDAEADAIASQVQRIHAHSPELSIGVITFYRAQVNRLWDSMEKSGLATQSTEGGARQPASGLDLQIGTVDSFQGLEFDVVFLSMTRANAHPVADFQDHTRKYGHLCIENRLCVAMSRAKRLMVVVGDAAMAEGDGARQAIFGLHEFLRLCRGHAEGGQPNGIVL